jgi:PilZ domain-containing protein
MAFLTTSQTGNALGERRRHSRRTPSSIVYITLGLGNGGLLLNLGTGGLAIQAVGKLTPDQDLVLQFRLAGSRDTIKTVGHVAWLGPTQKEAGVCFTDLPGAVEQRIAEWIATQEQSAAIEVRPNRQPVAATTGNSVLPDSVFSPSIAPLTDFSPIPRGTSLNRVGGDGSSVSPGSPTSSTPENGALWGIEDRGSGDRPQQTTAKLPDKSAGFSMLYGARRQASALPAEVLSWPVNQDPGTSLPAVESNMVPPLSRIPAGPSLAGVGAAADALSRVGTPPAALSFPPANAAEMLVESSALASSEIIAPSEVLAASDSDSGILPSSSVPSDASRRQRKLILAGLAGGLVLLAGITISVRSGKVPKHPVSSGQAVSAVAPPVDHSETGSKEMPERSIPVETDTGWSVVMRKLFRQDHTATIDPKLLNVPVWTYQRNGFYYCAGSPEIKKLNNGSFMTQAEALQSGYQPHMGGYCY